MFHHYPIYNQDDERSCGAYCIKMILKYHGVDEDITPIKQKLRTDALGATVRGLVVTLESYHCEVKAYHGGFDDLSHYDLVSDRYYPEEVLDNDIETIKEEFKINDNSFKKHL